MRPWRLLLAFVLGLFAAVGGTNADGSASAAGDWTLLPSPALSGLAGRVVAVWTGDQAIVWGGEALIAEGRQGPGYGARINLQSKTWQPITANGAPTSRAYESVVWTGHIMIVWGGVISAFLRYDGGQYDPSTDRWSPVTGLNGPGGRYGHTAVWTGTEMIIWGGYSIPLDPEQGAAYSPDTMKWHTLPNADFLQKREDHTAVWTGTEMLIWGGLTIADAVHGRQDPLGDGAGYDPSSRTWTLLPSDGAPGPRYGHTAVWTGQEMIIWGGEDGHGYFGDGAAYHPDTNTWTPLPARGAPSPRAWHTAVWTGTQMLIWGGEDSQGTLGDGAAYDPATNAWTPLPSAGAPSPRAHQAAVWTGRQLFIWGGCGECDPSGAHFAALGDGALYTPPAGPATATASPAIPRAPPGTGAGGASCSTIWQGLPRS